MTIPLEKRQPQALIEQARAAFEAGEPRSQVAAMLGTSESALFAMAARLQWTRRHPGNPRKITAAEIASMKREFYAGTKLINIARMHNASQDTVRAIVREQGWVRPKQIRHSDHHKPMMELITREALVEMRALRARGTTWAGIAAKEWCSKACEKEFILANDWGAIRRAVSRRDRGICQLCGADTNRQGRILIHAVRFLSTETHPVLGRFSELYHAGFTWQLVSAEEKRNTQAASALWVGRVHDATRDLWEADHIIPRVEGGANTLENLRTLCLKCHRAETAKLARRRACARRAEIDLLEGAMT